MYFYEEKRELAVYCLCRNKGIHRYFYAKKREPAVHCLCRNQETDYKFLTGSLFASQREMSYNSGRRITSEKEINLWIVN